MKTVTIEVPIIENERDLDEALLRIEALIDSHDPTHNEEIRVLGSIIRAYEDVHHPIGFPGPVEAIKFAMDQRGYTNKDLARILGAPSRASEIMSGKRQLSLSMIRRLHATWQIPLECLIEPLPNLLRGPLRNRNA
jgi:HTH-type transcriptional regulator/antitoxin HigA